MSKSEFRYTYSDDYWDEKLPVNGSHDPFFPKVGFVFGSFESGDKVRDAKFPDGWVLLPSKNKISYLLDENASCRAVVKTDSSFCHMRPLHRFTIELLETSITEIEICVWDRDYKYKIEKPAKVYSKSYSVPSKTQHPEIYKQRSQQYREEQACEKWLNHNFPKWNEYDAYWGEEFDFKKME